MVIVLKGADFSANNIGKVETELNEFTKAAIIASGNTNMNEEQKYALNHFFNVLGAFDGSGIWQKLGYLILPMITNSLDKSCVNYISNSILATPSGNWELRNGGLISTTSSVEFVTAKVTKIDVSNISIAYYRTEDASMYPASSTLLSALGLRGVVDGNKWFGPLGEVVTSDNANVQMKGLTRYINNENVSWKKWNDTKGARGISVNGNTGTFYCPIGLVNVTIAQQDDFSGETEQTMYLAGSQSKCPNGAMAVGSSLSPDELLILTSALEELGNHFVE